MEKPKHFIHWDDDMTVFGGFVVGRVKFPMEFIGATYGILLVSAFTLGLLGESVWGWNGWGAVLVGVVLGVLFVPFIVFAIYVAIRSGIQSFRKANGLDKIE